MDSDSDHDNDMDMVDIPASFSDDDDDDEEEEVENEYGERTLAPRTVTQHSSVAKNDFYKASVRRQNCCFGTSMLSLAGVFVAAYFVMGLSFTPNNIGIFGDESSMKGGSGEVGLDADNAQTQAIIDEEIIEVEEAGLFGENGKNARTKASKVHNTMKDLVKNHNAVGKNEWVEDKKWWKENAQHIDDAKKTKQEIKAEERIKSRAKRKKMKCDKEQKHNKNGKKLSKMCENLLATDLDSLEDKMGQYNFTMVGEGKESHPDMDDLNVKVRPGAGENGVGMRGKAEKNHQGKEEIEKAVGVQEIEEQSYEDSGETDNQNKSEEEDEENANDSDNKQVGEEQPVDGEPFIVLEQVIHDPSSFTQGLSYGNDGMIYETTGMYGSSKVRRINPDTFEVELSVDIDRKYFGEGSTFFADADGNGRIIEITWKKQTGFIYDSETLEKIKEFKYKTTAPDNEGWGITYDKINKEFIVSDGSRFLYFWDRDTLEQKRKVGVSRFNGHGQNQLNELEFIDGLVCCNIWHSDEIICVDPSNGKSIKEYDMSTLWPAGERGSTENVLNGIALGEDHILLTGKRWDRMYKVTFPDWPTLFLSSSDEDNTGKLSNAEDVQNTADLEHDQSNLEEPMNELAISNQYTVIDQVIHDPSSFTQGLSYGNDGMIYETTGMYGSSKVRRINPDTFEVELSVDIDRKYFGEGSTFFTDADGNGRIIEITWKKQTGFIYDSETLEKIKEFKYKTTAPDNEGWGITYDKINKEFIVSDGSRFLYFWDRDTLEQKRKVGVSRFNGHGQNQLNELEFIDGLVCCNIWHSDEIICVDPSNGKSIKEYDMSTLWPAGERGSTENVLNGIALGEDHILLTGKRWDRMYKVTFPDWPEATS